MRVQYFDLKPDEPLSIGDSRVTVQHKTGQRVRIKVESDEPTRKGAAIERPTQSQATTPFLPRPGTLPD
jgi:hypothetical protein